MNVSPYRLQHRVRWTVLIVCVAVSIGFAWAYWRLPALPAPSDDAPVAVSRQWPVPVDIDPRDWSVLQRRGGTAPTQLGPLGQRFRLAGTFFAYPGEGDVAQNGARRAIVDDIRARRQHLVQEGDEVDTVQVVSIFRDRIILREQAAEEELWLSFTDAPERRDQAPREPAATATPQRFEDMPALETSRFGKRIGENRWVLQREELLTYFDELQEDPERMTAIFLAMKPDIDEENEVAGYQLEMLGENVLYEAAGFQEGDIVRTVNSIPMTSPSRAEYFISEFLNERITAVVFDIERDGREEKLIHLLR